MSRVQMITSVALFLALAGAVIAEHPFVEVKRPLDRTFLEAEDKIFLGEKFSSGFAHIPPRGEMFYWYFPSRRDSTNDPFVLWLTGGPGCSSELAAIGENGPFWVNDNATLRRNDKSWNNIANVLYVDQPLGTGFSKAHFNVVVNEEGVAKDMWLFLSAFLDKFPDLKGRPFWITGESYAGHYIPSIAAYLLKRPLEGLNLKGMALGNAWVDPLAQYPAYADFAYDNKMINKTQYEVAKISFEGCVAAIKTKYWPYAVTICNTIMQSLLGDRNVYDIRSKCEVPPLCYNETKNSVFLNRGDVQKALGVSGTWRPCTNWVHLLLAGDFALTTMPKVAEVLTAGRQVLVYNGDKDLICNWMGGLDWVHQMEWKGAGDFKAKQLTEWQVEGKAAGQVKQVDNLAFLRVYEAGHMVPMDQPSNSLEMLSQFINMKMPATPLASEAQELILAS